MGSKTIKIEKIKGNQTIRIPKQMELDDGEVYLKKVGNALYIIPSNNPWGNLKESLELFTNDYLKDRIQPKHQERDLFDE
jgi:antitoxin VapB